MIKLLVGLGIPVLVGYTAHFIGDRASMLIAYVFLGLFLWVNISGIDSVLDKKYEKVSLDILGNEKAYKFYGSVAVLATLVLVGWILY